MLEVNLDMKFAGGGDIKLQRYGDDAYFVNRYETQGVDSTQT